jgi:NADH-quinone oxidoreductase subunit J
VSIAHLVFYLIAGIAIVGALITVLVPNVVHAALGLILSLFGVAGLYILLSSEFLGLVQVLIYAGAIATIILFGLMLTKGRDLLPVAIDGAQKPVAGLVFLVLLGTIGWTLVKTEWPRDVQAITSISTQAIGDALFRRWEVPFEIASVVLLVALIGAIVISRQEDGKA